MVPNRDAGQESHRLHKRKLREEGGREGLDKSATQPVAFASKKERERERGRERE